MFLTTLARIIALRLAALSRIQYNYVLGLLQPVFLRKLDCPEPFSLVSPISFMWIRGTKSFQVTTTFRP